MLHLGYRHGVLKVTLSNVQHEEKNKHEQLFPCFSTRKNNHYVRHETFDQGTPNNRNEQVFFCEFARPVQSMK